MHPWVKGIQVYLNEVPRPFPREDNFEIAKIIDEIKKFSSPEPLGAVRLYFQKGSLILTKVPYLDSGTPRINRLFLLVLNFSPHFSCENILMNILTCKSYIQIII